MESLEQAQRAVKALHLTKISASRKHKADHHKIGVKIADKQDGFRRDLQEWLIRRHKADVFEWTIPPETKFVRRRTEGQLLDLIPHYNLEKEHLNYYT